MEDLNKIAIELGLHNHEVIIYPNIQSKKCHSKCRAGSTQILNVIPLKNASYRL